MQIGLLDHVNLRTTQLDLMMTWYTDVLGLRNGDRPNFSFPGAWLYAGDQAVVHLVGIDAEGAVGSEVALKLEHFAFKASGAKTFEARLTEAGHKFRRVLVEDIQTIAFNVWDPDGNHIHVDFPAVE